MKRGTKFWGLILCLVLIIGLLPMTAFAGATQKLETPVLTWDGLVLRWNAVENATEYGFNLTDNGVDMLGDNTNDNYFDFSNTIVNGDGHTYVITVFAVGDGREYTDSDAASTTYVHKHVHSWSYSAKGNRIIASCSGCDETETLVLSVPRYFEYCGSPCCANCNSYFETTTGARLGDIKYTGIGETNYSETTDAPTDVGSYRASITAGGATAIADFDIIPLMVDSVAVTVDRPAPGFTPSDLSFSWVSDAEGAFDDCGYEYVWYIWNRESTSNNKWESIDNDTEFLAGEKYAFDLWLYTDYPYEVSEDVTATVNGNPSDTEYGDVYSDSECVYISYVFDLGTVDYKITAGDGGVYTKGSDKTLSFTCNDEAKTKNLLSLFDRIEIDGKEVSAENYNVSEGSIVLELKNAYLETLALGEHQIKFFVANGESNVGKFTVVPMKANNEPAEQKDDSKADDKPVNDTAKDETPAAPVGNGISPQTGDHINVVVIIEVLCVIGFIVAAVLVNKDKRTKSK